LQLCLDDFITFVSMMYFCFNSITAFGGSFKYNDYIIRSAQLEIEANDIKSPIIWKYLLFLETKK
jgi:hypothetical protein